MSEEVKVQGTVEETEEKKSFFKKVKETVIEHKDKAIKIGLVLGGTVIGALGVGALVNRSGVDYDEFEDCKVDDDIIYLGMADDNDTVLELEEGIESEEKGEKE